MSSEAPAALPSAAPPSADTFADGLPCPKCGGVTSAHPEVFSAFFHGEQIQCWSCSEAFDWWETAVEYIAKWPEHWTAFCLVGATTVFKDVELVPDRGMLLNLDEQLCVPREAEILRVVYTPVVPGEQRGPLPLEMTGWEARIRPVPHVLQLYGATYGHPAPESSTMKVGVTYVAHGPNETSARSLAEAAAQYAACRYNAMLVPANVAVEAAVYQATDLALKGLIGKEARRDFLENVVTYSYQLKVLVPMLCHMTGVPRLRDDIRGQLIRLRKLRNDMAHDGEPEKAVSKAEAARLLIAAVFGFHYARLLYAEFEKAQQEKRLPVPGEK